MNATTYVISNDNRLRLPITGLVLGWEDEDRVIVAWGDAKYSDDPWHEARVEWMDELAPYRHKI